MTSAHDDLVQAACQGDVAALDSLVRHYRARVYRYGVRVCGSEADADDAVQEVFGRLEHRLKGFRHEIPLARWLFTVVRNVCRRMLRPSRTRERLESMLATVERIATPQEDLEQAQLVAAVRDAIATLSLASREVLVLRDVEGLSGAETADRLGVSLAAMKTRLHRARTELRAAVVATRTLH